MITINILSGSEGNGRCNSGRDSYPLPTWLFYPEKMKPQHGVGGIAL